MDESYTHTALCYGQGNERPNRCSKNEGVARELTEMYVSRELCAPKRLMNGCMRT